jgi:hypothetical protein
VLRGGDDLPLVARSLQPQAGPLIGRAELGERVLDRARRAADDATELPAADGLLRDEEDRLDGVR